MKKGFTLIELLVVIAVIGILATGILNISIAARRQARDDRRVADLAQVRQALQLYFLKCGMYPGKYSPSESKCIGGIEEASLSAANNSGDWPTLAQTLSDAQIGFDVIPGDPIPGQTYTYWVQLGSAITPTPKAQCYVLRAQLETDHRALASDLDDAGIISKLVPTGASITAKNLFPDIAVGACDDSPAFNYCVGNTGCF